MDCFYRLVKKRVYLNLKLTIVYGISVEYLENGKQKQRTIHDVSSDRFAIMKLVDLCNKHRLDPYQLDDVIEDFLNNQNLKN